MAALLTHPQEFYGHCVSVSGYYSYGALFLSREHAYLLDGASQIAVWADEEAARCQQSWVNIIGILRYRDPETALSNLVQVKVLDPEAKPSDPKVRLCWSRPSAA